MIQNVLVIGCGNRKDLLEPFDLLKEKTNMFFLTYYSYKQLPNQNAKEFGSVVFWNDFSSGFDLLIKLDIHKMIFYEYESYNNIAIRAAAKQIGIKCYHLDHGFRGSVEAALKISKNGRSWKKYIYKIPFVSYFKLFFFSRFYYNTYFQCNYDLKKQLLTYYKIRSQLDILSTFERISSSLLRLDFYITYSREGLNFFIVYHHLNKVFKNYKFIGFPQFDELAINAKKKSNGCSNKLLFIDQPFYEQNSFGWTLKHKVSFLEDLKALVKALNIELIIKSHPLNDISIYKNLGCKVIDVNIFSDFLYSYVIGFNSTLLFSLASIPNTLLFCLNNHPKPFEEIKDNVFVKEKVAIGLNQLSDFPENFSSIKTNEKDRKEFIKKFLFKFDGKGKERLAKIILS